MSDKPSASFIDRIVSPVGIAVIVLVVIILSLGTYLYARKISPLSLLSFFSKQQQLAPTPTPTPLPTPIPRPIPHGEKGFSVGQSDHTIPQFGRGSINPYDPDQKTTQTVIIAVKYTQPVTKVSAMLKTDHTISQPVPFTLISGTNTDGKWQGSWKVSDTYLYIYQLILQAESSATKSASVTITLR